MTSLDDLYCYYCKRCGCKPNTQISESLIAAYEANGNVRQLDSIDISSNYVGSRGLEPLLELARNIPSLKRLDLRNNMLQHEDLVRVIHSLGRHPSITSINLSGNELHDASLGNILHLLKTNSNITDFEVVGNDFLGESLARVYEQLRENTRIKNEWLQQVDVTEEMKLAAEAAASKDFNVRTHSMRAVVEGTLTQENSGGHFHFASWRNNPQFAMYLSQASSCTVSIYVKDPIPTRQIGFAIMRGNALLRLIECPPESLLVESAFDDKKARIQIHLEAAPKETSSPYIIMPFTFSPKKEAAFTIVAEVENALGTVTVELLEARYDWAQYAMECEWTVANAGGCTSNPAWRDNSFFRVTPKPNARVASAKKGLMASLLVVLTKSNDQDVNDEREIGFYIMKGDAHSPASQPLRAEESTVAIAEHARQTSVTLRLEMPANALDFYIVPTTRRPQQLGPYTLTVFSSSEVQITQCDRDHGWSHQSTEAEWDTMRNGGCRKENPNSWVHNPSFEIRHNGSEPLDVLVTMEILNDDAGAQQEVSEAQISLLSTCEKLNTFAIGSFSTTESSISLRRLPPGQYYLVATTRRPGCHQKFRLRLYSSLLVYLSAETPLVNRMRENTIQNYAKQSMSRQAIEAERREASKNSSLPLDDEFSEAIAARGAAVQEYLASGALHQDRDFPRGESSLWLGAGAPNPSGPNVAAWKRPSQLLPDQQVFSTIDFDVDSISPAACYANEWLWNAVGAVATRPDWMSRVMRGYMPEYGLAQFSFFKSGVWRVVTIDDFLPVDALDDLCYSKGVSRAQDFFVPLLEKAYAKLHRCYDALHLGRTPRISASEATSQALVDLTGGVCQTYSLLHEQGLRFCKKDLWAVLSACQSSSRIVGGMLTNDAPNSHEKQYTGLFVDRLYTVVDARTVEGHRLIKLRNPWHPSEKVWAGKWVQGNSSLWTTAVIKALDQGDDLFKRSIWMSFDEFCYYFSEVQVVDVFRHSSWVEGGFAAGVMAGPMTDDTWVNNPQYALDIPQITAPTQIIVGMHQLDGRQTLTRHQDFEFAYSVPTGITVFSTDDNTRRLVHLSEKDSLTTCKVAAIRDNFFTITLHPNEKIIFMPFSTVPNRSQEFLISAWSEEFQPSISVIQTSTKTCVEGEWKGVTAGGSPTCGTWRNNPQYLLFPSETMEVTIVLRQRSDISSSTEYIGFSVLRAHDIRRALHHQDEDVLLRVVPRNDHAVVGTVRLLGMQERRGMPYIIAPWCLKAGDETGFTIEVLANKKVALKSLDPLTDWRRHVFTVSLTSALATAGGSRNFSSWRSNPQFLLHFPTERQGQLVVCATNKNVSDSTEIGITLIKSDSHWDNGKRRKIVLPAHDIICDSGSCVLHAEPAPIPFALERREPIILMPYTAVPHSDVTLEISVYCTADVTIEPVKEWYQEVAESSWDVGRTAGGDRSGNRTWINNPFFALSVTKSTHMVALLLQYPRGPEKPVYLKRIGKGKLFITPPITNPQNKIAIGIDLVEGNDYYTSIASTEHTYGGEVLLERVVPACDALPYALVPHSFEPEQDADFKLIVFADQPFQLHPIAKIKQLI